METLGTKLKSAREGQKLSLEKVSELTKIRVHIIKALENGNYTIVPLVYAKSFVITYAKLLKIPMHSIQDEIDEIFKTTKLEPLTITEPEKTTPEKKATKTKMLIQKDNKTRIVNLLIYLVITIAFSMVIYFTFFDSGNSTNPEETKKDADTTFINEKKDGLFSFYEEPDSIKLEAKATDSAWLKINIDGKISEQHYLGPGIEKQWSASEYFLITLGNAGAVEFKRNGEVLQKLGPPGSVVRNIKITLNEVVNSSKPWTSDTVVINNLPKKRFFKKPKPEPIKIISPTTIEKTDKDILERLKEIKPTAPSLKRKTETIKPIQNIPPQEEAKPPGLN